MFEASRAEGMSLYREPLHGLVVMNHLADSLGGANRSMSELAEALQAQGVWLTPVAMPSGRVRRAIAILTFAYRLTRSRFVMFNGAAAIVRFDPRWVQWLCRLFRRPLMVYAREAAYQYQQKYRIEEDNLRGRRLRSVYHDPATRLLFVSRFAKDSFETYFPAPRRCTVVGNGVRVPEYLVGLGEGGHAIRGRWVVNAATVQERKGYREFVRIAAAVCALNPDSIFIWLGDGPDLVKARELAADSGFKHRILFPGQVENVGLLLWLARAVFITSAEESFSRVAVEALALGTPLIVFRGVGGPEEIAGVHATIVDPDDSDRTIEVLNELLSREVKPEQRAAWRHHYQAHFSMEVHAERVARVLREWLAA